MSDKLRSFESLLEERRRVIAQYEAMPIGSPFRRDLKNYEKFLAAQRADVRVIKHEIRKERALCAESDGKSSTPPAGSGGGA